MAKIKGNKKNNKLKGKGQDDKIKGLGGDDQINGKGGNDKLIGGSGNDLLDGGDGDDKLTGGSGNDELFGGLGDDKLKAGSGNDFLDGGDGDDTMDGGDGDDFMEAGVGHDTFIGGLGIDTVSYALSALGVDIDLLQNDNTGGAQFDTFNGVENIDGSQFGDSIEGDGAANKIRGLNGDDYLKGGDGNDVLDGGEGRDQLYSDNGADQLIGGNGVDSLVYEKAASGAVINLATGVGGGSAAGDTFSGFEIVFGTKFADTITGGSASETFFGNAGGDDLVGNGGNDFLFGGAGQDDLRGGEGNDRLSPEGDVAEADHLFGGNGSDWADYDNAGAAVTVNLRTGLGAQRAAGDTYDSVENVQGSDFGDTLIAGLNGRAYGGWGDDFIYDGTGTEILRGERGADHLSDNFLGITEDGLRDIFVLEVNLGVDTIDGFTQNAGAVGDRFWLQESQFNIAHNSIGSLAADQIHNTTTSAANTASQHLIFDTDDNILYYDSDGTGSTGPITIAKINGLASISASDFVVVPDL